MSAIPSIRWALKRKRAFITGCPSRYSRSFPGKWSTEGHNVNTLRAQRILPFPKCEKFPHPRYAYRSHSTSSRYERSQADEEQNAVEPTNFLSAMRNMVKPFLLKCHPDVQGTEDAKEINLIAIQNLNAYLDGVKSRLKPAVRPSSTRNEKTVFEVDFCIMTEERVNGKKAELLSRRKVELSLPTPKAQSNRNKSENDEIRDLEVHIENQLFRLLHIAGMKVSTSSAYNKHQPTMEQDLETQWEQAVKSGDFSNISAAQIAKARKEKWRRNRDNFTRRINWKRFEEVYEQTLEDVHANWMTQGLIRDDPNRRMTYLSEILSRVRVENEEEVDPILQMIALRRLSMILDDNFDDLYLEELGKMWESTVIVLTNARDYNTSPSALYRRRKRKKTKGEVMSNEGFAFTLHQDNSVTIHIPVDFRDEELLSQLKRHTSDYYSLIGLGLDDYFPR